MKILIVVLSVVLGFSLPAQAAKPIPEVTHVTQAGFLEGLGAVITAVATSTIGTFIGGIFTGVGSYLQGLFTGSTQAKTATPEAQSEKVTAVQAEELEEFTKDAQEKLLASLNEAQEKMAQKMVENEKRLRSYDEMIQSRGPANTQQSQTLILPEENRIPIPKRKPKAPAENIVEPPTNYITAESAET